MKVAQILVDKGISYTTSGNDYLIKCLSPKHEDNNPSMRIDKELGIFQCMSCGYKGNIFIRFGIQVNKLETSKERIKRKIEELRWDRIGCQFPKDMIPYVGSWRGISSKTYTKFEAFKSAEKEFINRLVFPIRDITGRIVCFMGRDDTGTLNKRYLIHPGGRPLPLFPSVEPIKDRICIVEGIFDMLNLHDKGMTNAITTFGVNVKSSLFSTLKLQGISGVDILYDNDDAGKKGAEKAEELLKEEGLSTRIVEIPEGRNDPAELTTKQVLNLRKFLYE